MIKGRPRDAFEEELFPQLPFFRAFAKKLAGEKERGEDLFGDTIVKMYANKDSYRLGSSIKAWGFFIMKTTFYSERRRAWRQEPWSDELTAKARALDNPLAELELKEVLESFKYLEPAQAEALLMAADGLSYEEIALESGVEVGTAKSRVARARVAMGKLFAA